MSNTSSGLAVVGWREWISIPRWGINATKAKIDTGALSSAIHAERAERFSQAGQEWVRFVALPWQDSTEDETVVETPVVDTVEVRSSNGQVEQRLVVTVTFELGSHTVDTHMTLTERSDMGFRVLLGRRALAGIFMVNPAESYLHGTPERAIRRKNRGR